MKDIYTWAGALLAILLYFPTLFYIWTDKLKQSFATWILWVTLDVIALGSIIAQSGENSLILKCYITGGSIVSVSLLLKKQFKWTRIEWRTLGLVAMCVEVWVLSGPWWATIASTSAVCLSGIPQFLDSKRAERDPITGSIYLGYTVSNILFFMAGKSWSVEDRFYGGMTIPLCLVIAWAALRRRTPEESIAVHPITT